MTNLARFIAIASCSISIATPALAADVGVLVTVGQPGFYGRIEVNQPPPPVALIYRQPIVIVRPPARVARVVEQPIYLHVPPGHAKKWSKHCRRYSACGRPVYFVRDDYYDKHYVVRGEHRGHDRHDRDDERGDGRGKGHGKGHDKHR